MQLAKEAFEVEEKEEKLVSDAVKHLSEANVKINVLTSEFSSKAEESRRQKEEITHLLAKVCDLQAKNKGLRSDNAEFRGNQCAYKETQEELTAELADFKEKYREIVDLLRDTQEELRRVSKKRKSDSYQGLGEHGIRGMFSQEIDSEEGKKNHFDLCPFHFFV